MVMFRRKAAAEIEGEVCPYCEFVNTVGSETCSQCYYDLKKKPREQGESVSDEVSDSIFDELMSDEDDTWVEGDALDVVLSLDSDPLDVEQYEVTNFEAESPEKIGFIQSSPPELYTTVSHQPDDTSVEDVGEPISNVEKLDFSNDNPLANVPEPVPQGKGTVFSPSTPSKMDDDLLGHVGGTELPSLPPDDLYENKIDLNVKKAPAPTPEVALPSYVAIEPAVPIPKSVPLPEAEIVQESQPESIPQPEPQPEPEPEPEPVAQPIPVPQPAPQLGLNRIWPWPESEAWDPRVIHREIVSALEQVKSGKVEEATKTIDTLGPHLSEENVDLIYHVGMVLKQIGRTEEVKAMLDNAKLAMPDNEHVSSAVTHLGV
tara:strand:+ start:1207 stop:2328 length:1122 start_codon:yes stop_codon:yes gene_type:complete